MAGFNAAKEMPDFMVGSCLTMCPSAEVRLRQAEGLLHPLEKTVNANGERMNYASPRFMVKEFSRSAAGNEIKPSDIRPLPVLAKTVKFLLSNSCCRTDVSWTLIYQFVSDRLRAVRQDLCVQGVKNIDCIKLHLASVRFHAYSHYRMCEHEVADFDPYLNKKMLLETLTLILAFYRDLDKEKQTPDTREEYQESQSESEENWTEDDEESEKKIARDAETNEKSCNEEASAVCLDTKFKDLDLQDTGESYVPGHTPQTGTESESRKQYEKIRIYSSREEAEALYIIVKFGSEEALSHALSLPKNIRCSPLVSLALEMSSSWLIHNYSRVIHLSTFLPPLFLCAFHPHIAEVERKALSILSRSHSCKGQIYSKDDLAKMLFFSDISNMKNACDYFGIEMKESGVVFNKGSFKTDAPLRKINRLQWIEEALDKVPLSELLIPQDLLDADFNLLPDEHENEEEESLLEPPGIQLKPGSNTAGETCNENTPLNRVLYLEQADEVEVKLPTHTGVSVPDQDIIGKSPLQSNKEHLVVEDSCSRSVVCEENEMISVSSSSSEVCTLLRNEKDNLMPFSQDNGNLSTLELSANTSITAEDSGVSVESSDQIPCYPVTSEDSLQEPMKVNTPVEVTDKESVMCRSELNKAELRRRKRQEDKEAIVRKVQKMKEKQKASEDWMKKKNMVYLPIAYAVGILMLSAGIYFFYQYVNSAE